MLIKLRIITPLMMSSTPSHTPNLRQVLREHTQFEHEEVEAAFERFDLSERAGLAGMLDAHWRALTSLLPSLETEMLFHAEVVRLRGLAGEGLRVLGRAVDAPDHSGQTDGFHPLGVAYVILGSRLGAATLSARLTRAGVPEAAPEAVYLRDRQSLPHWRTLTGRLSAPVSEQESRDILAGAHSAFHTFRRAAMTSRPCLEV